MQRFLWNNWDSPFNYSMNFTWDLFSDYFFERISLKIDHEIQPMTFQNVVQIYLWDEDLLILQGISLFFFLEFIQNFLCNLAKIMYRHSYKKFFSTLKKHSISDKSYNKAKNNLTIVPLRIDQEFIQTFRKVSLIYIV